MVTEEERILARDRLLDLLERLPPQEATTPFVHIMGTSLTIQQMIAEIEAGTILGDEIVKSEMEKLKRYRGY